MTRAPVAALVPELTVADIGRSLAFYVDGLGFETLYDRKAERFAYLAFGAAELMLEEESAASWVTAAMEHPRGRGASLQIAAADVGTLRGRLAAAGVALWRDTEEVWYRRGAVWTGARQFLVQDPDGYLLRFLQSLGETGAPHGRGGRVVG